jgi:hypothetical protein
MFSVLRHPLVYTNISSEITELDEDYDASEWSYNGRNVYRGTLDSTYTKEHSLDIYWLYDENLLRVGLAEHETNDSSIFEVLWFYDTPFGTLLQEPMWKSMDKTIWSLLTPEAYQDTLENKDVLLLSGKVITPEYIINGLPNIYECEDCKKRSFSLIAECKAMKKIEFSTNPYFIDSSFILYSKPKDSRVQRGVYVQKHQDLQKKVRECQQKVDGQLDQHEHHHLHEECQDYHLQSEQVQLQQ